MTDNNNLKNTSASAKQSSSPSTKHSSGPAANDIGASLRSVHDELVNVAHSAGSIDIRSFEGLEGSKIFSGLGPVTFTHLTKALAHTRTLFSLCDQWEQKTAPGSSQQSGEAISRDFDFEIDKLVFEPTEDQSPRDNVADLAFIAKSELNERLERLNALTSDDDPWNLLAEYDSALRRTRKSLAAVDYVLCKAESLPQCLDFQTELEVSLLVRRAYIRLRRSLAGSHEPTEANIYSRLRAAGTQIAVLVGRDVYPHLRIRDRAQLRDVQKRLLEWMREERDNPRAGMRIWQDMMGVIDMFCQVSRRQELVDHDAEKIEQIHRALEAEPEVPLADMTTKLIEAIEGLDREIDELLAGESRRDPAVWAAPISRLMVHFGLSAPKAVAALNIMEDGDFF